MWLTNFSQGYEVKDGPRFAQSVQQKLGGFPRWDEVIRGLEMVLRRNPKAVGKMLSDGIFVLPINIPTNSSIYLQYKIDDEAMCVTYLELL